MSEGSARFQRYLADQPEGVWTDALTQLLPEIHEVDRAATRIWQAFWPPKLTRELQTSADPLQTAQQLLLYGEYELAKGLARSVDFLYGGRYWPEVCRGLLAYSSEVEADTTDIGGHVRALARGLAQATGTEPSLLTGVSFVGLAALGQLGPEPFSDEGQHRHPMADRSVEEVCRHRRREKSQGWLGFLRTVNQLHDVRWNEADDRCTFEAVHGQDITMAGAAAEGDYSELDARRVEGPVPIQCRNGACGFCWVGILHGAERLSEITPFEKKRMALFGYLDETMAAESHPPVRLACQARVQGDVTIVVPPWNGVLNGRS